MSLPRTTRSQFFFSVTPILNKETFVPRVFNAQRRNPSTDHTRWIKNVFQYKSLRKTLPSYFTALLYSRLISWFLWPTLKKRWATSPPPHQQDGCPVFDSHWKNILIVLWSKRNKKRKCAQKYASIYNIVNNYTKIISHLGCIFYRSAYARWKTHVKHQSVSSYDPGNTPAKTARMWKGADTSVVSRCPLHAGMML